MEQRGGETVIEFARSGEAQGEFHLGKVVLSVQGVLFMVCLCHIQSI